MNKLLISIFGILVPVFLFGATNVVPKVEYTRGFIENIRTNDTLVNARGVPYSVEGIKTFYTNSIRVTVTNTADFQFSGFVANAINAYDIRLYLDQTNSAPYSASVLYEVYDHSNRRAENLLFSDAGATAASSAPTTNGTLMSTLFTSASGIGATTSAVTDASSIIIGDMYYQQDALTGSNGFVRAVSVTGNVVTRGSANYNSYGIGSLYSHVERFTVPFYQDLTGSSSMWFRVTFPGNVTNSITIRVVYVRL